MMILSQSFFIHSLSIIDKRMIIQTPFIFYFQWSIFKWKCKILRLLWYDRSSRISVRIFFYCVLSRAHGVPGGDVLHDGLEDDCDVQKETELDESRDVCGKRQNKEGSFEDARLVNI